MTPKEIRKSLSLKIHGKRFIEWETASYTDMQISIWRWCEKQRRRILENCSRSYRETYEIKFCFFEHILACTCPNRIYSRTISVFRSKCQYLQNRDVCGTPCTRVDGLWRYQRTGIRQHAGQSNPDVEESRPLAKRLWSESYKDNYYREEPWVR